MNSEITNEHKLTSDEVMRILTRKAMVQSKINDIINYKKGQKRLYAKFYEEQRNYETFKEQFNMRGLSDEEWKMFELDTSEIFYKKKE